MTREDSFPADGRQQGRREHYDAPTLTVLGSVAEVTAGPDPGVGDVPSGVISF